MHRLFVVLVILTMGSGACESPESEVHTDEAAVPSVIQEPVEQAMQSLDAMRSGLAKGIDMDNVDAGTFAQVCKPVGKQAMEIGKTNGWTVRQIAVKNRNPANRADDEAAALFADFEAYPEMDSLWLHTSLDGTPGWRYLRRITVEPACLTCHGAKEQRPSFVQTGYPEDKAFGFKAGDLRGLYSVFVPDDTLLARAVPRLEAAAFLSSAPVDAAVLDVRTPEEYREGYLPGAQNIDFRASDFKEKVAQLDRDKTYYLYCRTGNRSGQGAAIMRELGFQNLYNIGGLSELEAAGAEVVR